MVSDIATNKRTGIYAFLGVPTPFDTSHTLVTSPIVPPLALAVLRLTLAVYGLVFVLFRLIYEGIHFHSDESFFSYFTSLSYIGLLAYFWAAGVQTLAFAPTGCKWYPLQRWWKPLQFLHMLLFWTIVTYLILVTAVFWSLLSSPDTFATRYSAWTNISEHALNTAFAAFEILLTNAGILSANGRESGLPWIHLPFLIALLACYLGVAYITAGTQHFYTYSFLDPEKQHAKLAAYIIGIAVGEIALFVLVRYTCILREYLVMRLTRVGLEQVRVEEGTGKRYHGLLADLDADDADVDIEGFPRGWEEVALPGMTSAHHNVV